MGIQVGHVISVKPMYDEVLLTFVIKEKNIDLPKGTLASVQFTGLAGSKSLELFPPHKKYTGHVKLIAVEPIKLDSLMTLQNDILESYVNFSYNVRDFFGKNTPCVIRKRIKQHIQTTKQASDKTKEFTQKTNQLTNTITEKSQQAKQFMNESLDVMGKPVLMDKKDISNGIKFIKNIKNEKNIKKLNEKTKDISSKTTQIKKTTNSINVKKQVIQTKDDLLQAQDFAKSLKETITNENINKTQKNIDNIKKTTQSLNKTLE